MGGGGVVARPFVRRLISVVLLVAWFVASAAFGASPVAAASANLVITPEGGATAAYTADSAYSGSYAASKAADGNLTQPDGFSWARNQCAAPRWWRVTWSASQTVDYVRIMDRADGVATSFGTSFTLSYSDGTTTGPYAMDGTSNAWWVASLAVVKTGITWVQVNGVAGGSSDCGLQEVEVYNGMGGPPPSASPAPSTNPVAAPPDRVGGTGTELGGSTGSGGGGAGSGNGSSGGGYTGGTSGSGTVGGADGDALPDEGAYIGRGYLGKTYSSNPDSDLSTSGGCPDKGPLSGDIGKPLVCLLAIDQCQAPSFALDVPGWLSYVWCEIRQIPRHLVNAFFTGINIGIDLAIPAPIWGERLMARVAAEYDDHGADGATGLFTAGGAGMATPGQVTLGGSIFGGQVDLWVSIQSVMSPARPVLGWLVYGAFAVWAWGMWRRHVMGQESDGLAIATGGDE